MLVFQTLGVFTELSDGECSAFGAPELIDTLRDGDIGNL